MKTDKKSEQWLTRDDRRRSVGGLDRPSFREWRRENALASWLGDERRAEVFADLRPEPRSMGELVSEAMAAVGKNDMLLLADLREHWADIVGTRAGTCPCTRSVFSPGGPQCNSQPQGSDSARPSLKTVAESPHAASPAGVCRRNDDDGTAKSGTSRALLMAKQRKAPTTVLVVRRTRDAPPSPQEPSGC